MTTGTWLIVLGVAIAGLAAQQFEIQHFIRDIDRRLARIEERLKL